MKASTKAIRFIESLSIPENPKAGFTVKLAPFQKQFVEAALAGDVNLAVVAIDRLSHWREAPAKRKTGAEHYD